MPKITVLVIDDDPTQLKLYSWILEHGGFKPFQALVGSNEVNWPECDRVDVVALDYRLTSKLTAVDVAHQVRERFPDAQVLVLSEMFWMPADIAPLAAAFVSKGNPEELISTVSSLATERKVTLETANRPGSSNPAA